MDFLDFLDKCVLKDVFGPSRVRDLRTALDGYVPIPPLN
jgi:hypothetical protein